MRGIAITTAAVALGGGLGAMIRSASECAGAALGIASWGVVLIINVLGCVAMGFLFFCHLFFSPRQVGLSDSGIEQAIRAAACRTGQEPDLGFLARFSIVQMLSDS